VKVVPDSSGWIEFFTAAFVGSVHGPLRPHRLHRPAHWYRRQTLSAFHGLIESLPIGDVHQMPAAVERRQRGKLTPVFCARKSARSAVSTSSDIVRPCRTDSRFSLAMTDASMFNVVFIWETMHMIWIDVKRSNHCLL
jgi:hypothetical protein